MSEKRYRIQNVVTNEVKSRSLREARNFLSVINPSTGQPMFRALQDMPGTFTDNEGAHQTLIPKERVGEALGDGPLQLLRSDKDPAWDAARRNETSRARQKVAAERSGGEVFTESLLSGVTFGQSSRLANALAGPDSAELRALAISKKGGAHFAGQATSLLALGLLPIPGLGGLTVGAKTGLRSGTIFEAGASAAAKVRGAITGEGFGAELARRIAAPVAFGAVADAPLAAAMVAADIVDRNKDFTGESIAADFLTQYGFALSIAGATSLVAAPFVAGAAVGARRATTQLAAAQQSGRMSQEMFDSATRGFWRYFSRKKLRSRFFGAGDIIETQGYKTLGKISKQPGRMAAEHPMGRLLAAREGDEFYNLTLTIGQNIDGLAGATTKAKILKHTGILLKNTDDPVLIGKVSRIREMAADIPAAQRKVSDMVVDSRRLAEQAAKIEWVQPLRAVTGAKKNAGGLLDDALQRAGLPKVTGSRTERLTKALNLRKQVPTATRAQLDADIVSIFPRMESAMPQIQRIEKSVDNILRLTREYGDDATGLRGAYNLLGDATEGVSNPNSLRANVRALDGSFRNMINPKVRAVKNPAAFTTGKRPLYRREGKKFFSNVDTRLDDLRPAIDALGELNTTVASLRVNAKPLIRAKKPMTQAEILGSQVETVMTYKERMGRTLAFVALKGGGARQTASFGGVYTYRNLTSAEEKKQAFRAYHDAITSVASSPERLVAHVGDMVGELAGRDMGLGVALAETQMTAYAYLHQQMPRSADPAIGPEDMSMAEIENFLEAVGALTQPLSVVATAADGSTTDQAVDAFRTVYPELYVDALVDVAEFVAEHGDKLGHTQLIGLDTFTGYSLGYLDGPAPSLTIQPPFFQTPQQAASVGAVGGPEHRRMDLQENMTPAQRVGGI